MIGARGDGMADVRDRDRTAAPPEPARRSARPVVLATLSVRIDPAAEEMAVASALEAGVPLIVANMLHLPPYPATVMLVGPGGATLPHEEALDEVRATAARAAALGIRTELLRVSSRHPVRALLELVAERDAGLLVFGPATGRIRGPRLRAAARRVRRDAPCLVWIAPDG
jgi:nucleotide-binding universal stress UspA family protein